MSQEVLTEAEIILSCPASDSEFKKIVSAASKLKIAKPRYVHVRLKTLVSPSSIKLLTESMTNSFLPLQVYHFFEYLNPFCL